MDAVTGCCSAIEPCSHQRKDPATLCEICQGVWDRAHKPAFVSLPEAMGLLKKPEPKDEVYHPPHYARWAMEPIEFIAINDLPWWLANIVKYCMRFDAKNGLEDLYKARSYLDMKIRSLEGVVRFWDKPVSEERKQNKKDKP